jgi:hypothetical protein
VTNLRFVVLVEKNVGRFDVSVNNTWVAILMQICKTSSASKTDPQPCVPVQEVLIFTCTSKSNTYVCIHKMMMMK